MIAPTRALHNLKIWRDTKVFLYDRRVIAPSHLRALQAIELAVRTGSMVAAAKILKITPAAAGQRVKTLEDFLGVELLTRGRFGVVASAELLRALPHLRTGFAEIQTAAAALELQRAHHLHVVALPDFADLWLAPRLAPFQAEFPNMRFSINGESEGRMRIGKPDVEIAFAAPESVGDGDLLFHDVVLPLCSPANAKRTHALKQSTRLEGFPLLHVDFYKDDPAKTSWPQWFSRHGIQRTAPERGMRYRRIASALDAINADAGVALCGVALLLPQIDRGAVELAFPDWPGQQTSYAFIARYRPNARGMRQVERFRQWLRVEAAKTAARLDCLCASKSADG